MSSAEGDSGHDGCGAAAYRGVRQRWTGTATVSDARNCSFSASLASQIQLAGEKRHPDREPAAAGAWRDQGPDREQPEKRRGRSARTVRRRDRGAATTNRMAADSAPSALRRSSTTSRIFA